MLLLFSLFKCINLQNCIIQFYIILAHKGLVINKNCTIEGINVVENCGYRISNVRMPCYLF